MKRSITTAILCSILIFSACKDKSKTSTEESSAPASSSSTDSKPAAANEPESFQVAFSPDSAVLGKLNEALVKISGAKAITLQDPDGKNNGTELTINLNVTNRTQIGNGNHNVSVSYADSRLQLDNGTNITCTKGTDFLNADPEATSKTETWTYVIPAGAKPVALNLFMDQTRVSVKLEMK